MRPTILLFAALCACGGARRVPLPADLQGYRSIELKDVAPTGLKDANVELVAFVAASGVGAFEACELITIETMSAPPPMTGEPAAVASFAASMPSYDAVTLTLPRSRYAEVRDLQPFERVRVRGYLSDHEAQGCGYSTTEAHRYLWVDTLERLKTP